MPIAKTTPASHSAAATKLLRKILPTTTGAEDKKDARQRLPMGDGRPAPFGLGFVWRQKRLDAFPQFVREQRLGHFVFLLEQPKSTEP
jgi:hypothetical protein